MSKKAKNAAQERRKKEKRSRKAAEQAKYAAWAADGKNQKSKRNVLKNKRAVSVRTVRHAVAFCGNVGCKKCHPELNLKPRPTPTPMVALVSRNRHGTLRVKLIPDALF